MTWKRVLADKRHLMWPLAVGIVANLALLIVVVFPLLQKVAGAERRAEAAAGELAAARQDLAVARATVTGKDAADKALTQFYSAVLPPDLSGARRSLVKIEQLLAQANLRRVSSRMRPEAVRDSSLSRLAVTVDFTGDYSDVRRFLYALETSPEFLVVENVQLIQEADGKTPLRVTTTVSTYYRAGGDGN
jgi:Tfp pilus assembly protein PilO